MAMRGEARAVAKAEAAQVTARRGEAPRAADAPTRVPWALPAVFVGLTLLRAAVLPRLGLFNDEAYYWEWSRRLAASYFDHPPAVAYLIAGSTALFGTTRFAIHLPALVLSVLTSGAVYALALSLFPGRRDVGWWSLALVTTAPLLGIGAVFTVPDGPLFLAWAVTSLLAWRAISGRPGLWYAVGAAAGLGLLSKYGFVLLPPALFLFLAWRRRDLLARKEPWIAVAIMVLAFAPVVVFNLQTDFASVRYHLVDRHSTNLPLWKTLGRFFLGQQALSPLTWAACVAGLVHAWRRAREGSDAHAFLLVGALVPLAFFGLVSLRAMVNPNWYAPAFLPAGVAAGEILAGARSRWVRVTPLALAGALTAVFYVHAATLVLPLPPGLDFANDLHGWEDVGARLREEVAAMPDPARTYVFSRRLQLSAMAAFYGGEDLDVTRIGGRHDQYDLWRRPERRGEDAIYFCDDTHFAPPPAEAGFGACDDAGALPVVRAGRRIRTFHFWRCLADAHRRGGAQSTQADGETSPRR